MYICMYIYMYIYVNMYRERDIDTDMNIYTYTYIYMRESDCPAWQGAWTAAARLGDGGEAWAVPSAFVRNSVALC